MKKRSKRELLKLVIYELENNRLHIKMQSKGLCHYIYTLYSFDLIYDSEHEVLSKIIDNNRPSMNSKLFPHHTINTETKTNFRSIYYFKPYDWEIRLKWLKYLLNKELKKDGKKENKV